MGRVGTLEKRGVAEMSGTPKSAPQEEKKVQTVRFAEGNSERSEAKDERYFKNGSELQRCICQRTYHSVSLSQSPMSTHHTN